jgi:putative glutathione S-transferase
MFDGVWQQEHYDAPTSGGRFVRRKTRFHDRITADGASGFKAEPGRYHLYVSYACPWAHRTLIFRALKGLEEVTAPAARRTRSTARTACTKSTPRPGPTTPGV